MSQQPAGGGKRRIDRIRSHEYVAGLADLSLEDLRERRDECIAEREYLSLLRRLVQGRAEILQAEITSRAMHDDAGPLVDRLASILSSDDAPTPARGEAVRVGVPEEELLLARRRVERLVSDAGISDPSALDDGELTQAADTLVTEEHEVSGLRADVIAVLDTLQAELKRRYKDDPTLALR